LVTVDPAAEADRTFDMLMGDAVDPRKLFIQTHARPSRIWKFRRALSLNRSVFAVQFTIKKAPA
jgi:hypothetical protein